MTSSKEPFMILALVHEQILRHSALLILVVPAVFSENLVIDNQRVTIPFQEVSTFRVPVDRAESAFPKYKFKVLMKFTNRSFALSLVL